MASTIKDIAHISGVAPSTVSRAINNSGYVSEETRSRIMKTIEKCGYSPSAIAVSLSKNKTRTIGVVVPDICNSFFSEVFYAASKRAEEENYRLILCNTDDNVGLEARALQDMLSYRVSGIIMTPVSDKDGANVELLKNIQNSGVSVVFVDREMRGINCDGVFIDNERSSYEAASLLLNEGHRKIAIIAGPQDTVPGRERMRGFMEAMQQYKVVPEEKYTVIADFKDKSSYTATRELLNSADPPTAIFTCNNLMTIGCLRAIIACGKKVPDDIALVGFDDVELLDVLGYNLSLVSRATSEMGTVAAKLLLDRIEGRNDPSVCQRIVLQSHLKICGSEKLVKKD